MHEPARPVSRLTWVGLAIALFAILLVRQAVSIFYPSLTLPAAILRESLVWLFAIALLIIVRRGEGLPLTSIGIGTSGLLRSLLWGAVFAVVCAVVGFAIAIATHFHGGKTGESLSKLPLWLSILIVVRAGVIEELFYRGYAIERLQAIGLNKFWAVAVPLAIFGLGHLQNGWANVAIALALGGVLSASYLWRRDLIANMIAHFAVDFVGIILPRLVHHS
ncbi:MAG TPA: type II CAAX endopeptidase family protein [Chthoniobacterales bacterium]|jgi:membrane protease YdiL (CAAX protease family)